MHSLKPRGFLAEQDVKIHLPGSWAEDEPGLAETVRLCVLHFPAAAKEFK